MLKIKLTLLISTISIIVLSLITLTVKAQNLVGTTTVIWSDLPHQSMDYGDKLIINSPLYNNLQANITKDRVVISSRGASFHTDMTEDLDSYPEWVQVRAELREAPLSSVIYGNTQIYEFEFEVDTIPQLAGGGVTIFQRFNKSLDDPDFSIILKGDEQWPSDLDLKNSSIVMKPFNLPWVKTYTLLKQKNHLKIAIYSHENGYYKVSLNGITLGQGDANATPDTVTYSGPQFGIYNHGKTIERIGLTHTKYVYTEYDSTINFNTITTIDPNIVLNTKESKIEKIKIYPNPVNDCLYINNVRVIMGKEILIFDVIGNIHLKKVVDSNKINVIQLKSGLYFLKIENSIIKFIKK